MERNVLIRNIAYMERELAEMKKQLACMDARWEQQEQPNPHCTEEALLFVDER